MNLHIILNHVLDYVGIVLAIPARYAVDHVLGYGGIATAIPAIEIDSF
jgi:hypothetical protein